MRRWLAKLWVVLFALSYSAAAIAAHCQAHFAANELRSHAHHHIDHDHDGPAHPATGDGCAAMAWEKMLAPAPMLATAAPAAPEMQVLPAAIVASLTTSIDIHTAAESRPPPDVQARGYTAIFARTGRLLI